MDSNPTKSVLVVFLCIIYFDDKHMKPKMPTVNGILREKTAIKYWISNIKHKLD